MLIFFVLIYSTILSSRYALVTILKYIHTITQPFDSQICIELLLLHFVITNYLDIILQVFLSVPSSLTGADHR